MNEETVGKPMKKKERAPQYSQQEIHNFMKDLAPQATINTAYYTHTFECLCALVENGPLDYNYHPFIRNMAQKLNVNPGSLKGSIDRYIQNAWYTGNKQLMLRVMSHNIDTKATPSHPGIKEFLDACFDYFNSQGAAEDTIVKVINFPRISPAG